MGYDMSCYLYEMVTFMGIYASFSDPIKLELKMTILEVHGGFWEGWLYKKKHAEEMSGVNSGLIIIF